MKKVLSREAGREQRCRKGAERQVGSIKASREQRWRQGAARHVRRKHSCM
jgi:hypothetical protein